MKNLNKNKIKSKFKMKFSNRLGKFLNAKRLINLLAVMIILNGCRKIAAPIVKISDFCEGRFESQFFTKKDFINIAEIRQNPSHKETIEKFTNNTALNEKEFNECKKIK